ncbi:hypothetical protein CYLTODRAFT_488021 [Cylindrobasidium torrendii FP15055 ss-10]|uniref:Uncharacterized protein n=1 Tax=Cylindrobasidium torrendii FP15055 ss-10 TaxID=1314674 RepID=A0A0D7BLJ3_9AGAR|nr:hypothetical protein CYLTODRAFT_488021 [Cylindrobasidium torrendii FP15055 ss-10]
MAAIYTEDCISLSPHFTEPTPMTIERSGVEYMLEFASSTGIGRARLAELLDSPSNTIHIQPNLIFAFKSRKISFVPIPSTVASMADLYNHNYTSADEERRCMDDITELKSPLFRFNIAKFNYPGLPHLSRSMPVYTKHPFTGHVTKHVAPYSDLPIFKTKTAHASLLVLAALSSRIAFNLIGSSCDPWRTLAFKQRPVSRDLLHPNSSRISQPVVSSRKRKAITGSDQATCVPSAVVSSSPLLKKRCIGPRVPSTCAVEAKRFHPMQTRLAAVRSGHQY